MSEVNIRELKAECGNFNGKVAESQPLVGHFGELAQQGSERFQAAAEKLGEAAAILLGVEQTREGAGNNRNGIGEKIGAALDLGVKIGFASATKNQTIMTVPGRTEALGQPADQINGSFAQSHETAKAFVDTLNNLKQGLENEGNRLMGSLEEPTKEYNGNAGQIIQDVEQYAATL